MDPGDLEQLPVSRFERYELQAERISKAMQPPTT
jgi:hypothetical protein